MADYSATGSGPVLSASRCMSWMTSRPPDGSAAKDFSSNYFTTGVSQSCRTFENKCMSKPVGSGSWNISPASTETRPA